MRRLTALLSIVAGAALLACNDNTGSTLAVVLKGCDTANTVPITLAVGESRIVDAAHEGSCIRLPGAAAAQEYVVVEYAGQGGDTPDGLSSAYAFQGDPPAVTTAAAAISPPLRRRGGGGALAARFDANLRRAERALAPFAQQRPSAAPLLMAPPALGDRDSFFVCADINCGTFRRVGATIRYVGQPGLIYVDDVQLAGADSIGASGILQLGELFDQYLYPTDTTAFGRESDIDGDQHIAMLITPAVNALTADCTNGRVIGYFFGNDLVPGSIGSNAREMFYTFTTAPETEGCDAVDRTRFLTELPPTLIHEFQHMISFNQHVLIRGGLDQETWLNEGLSHFAEELGTWVVPDADCPEASDCFSEFVTDDLLNAFDYLSDTESGVLVVPSAIDPGLAQRGAAWLFVRWLADHYSADTLLGTQVTRGLEMSTTLGAARIAQITGVDFPTLVGDWQLANWLDDLPGFPQSGLLSYRTWDFRDIFAANYPNLFAAPFPLVPDSTSGAYTHLGTLLQGTGRTVRFQLPAGSPSVAVRLAGSDAGAVIDPLLLPRFAVVRTQ